MEPCPPGGVQRAVGPIQAVGSDGMEWAMEAPPPLPVDAFDHVCTTGTEA
eukprot:CAMPEP_0177642936 /NCGR_PEP_ID=MMETSP0447-20121125/7883_1 /TAXON_ID=0 /ORGANISM="Stygamoeba regulata, Strain BSH-02190019" /LENGTH=49 /DNA_ID= /DNA_START= /DNA_END= /DNA_ORIENTATION=